MNITKLWKVAKTAAKVIAAAPAIYEAIKPVAKPIVKKLVDRVFDGSAQRLVAHLLETQKLTEADREELLNLLKPSATKVRLKGDTQGEPS